jgi:hypothetical protein
LLPNQSLKLTEIAVDDFAARQKNFLMKCNACRAYSLQGTGCTSPQLSSGSLANKSGTEMEKTMRYILVLSIFLLFNSGCKKDDSPTQSSNQQSTTVSTLSDSVLYTLTIPTASFSTQDTLEGIFSIWNQAKTSRTFSDGDSPIFGWTLKNDIDSIVINMSGGVAHHTSSFTINPNESTSFTIQHGLANLPVGLYKLDTGLGLYRLLVSMTPYSPVLSLTFSLHSVAG